MLSEDSDSRCFKTPSDYFCSLEEGHSENSSCFRDAAALDQNNALGKFCISLEILQSRTDLIESDDLEDPLPNGFEIHHPGMSRSDCKLVEKLFSNGRIQIGFNCNLVNLPAHTVLIKGTTIYNPGKMHGLTLVIWISG